MTNPNSQPLHLGDLLSSTARRSPNLTAVEDEAGRSVSYATLDHIADRLATRLARWGIARGDRVGLLLPKSIEAVASIHGILRTGAAYVPADPTAPPLRAASILADAQIRALIVAAPLAEPLFAHWPSHLPKPRRIFVQPAPSSTLDPADTTWDHILNDSAPTPLFPPRHPDDLAYILYTSGSTGTPKGVMLSHTNANCFLNWCDSTLGLQTADRFSAHAPFHFDLSVFDLFASCRHSGTLILIGEALARDPHRLGPFLHDRRIHVWYSAPSILTLLTQCGGLDEPGRHAPRIALFAGEVFPITHLRRLRALWPHTALWNLYGPTETNVCTAFPIPQSIPDHQTDPFPIGRVCPPLQARVIDDHNHDVPPGSQGELIIAGPGVMRGYFGRPDLNAQAFLIDDHGTPWYRTGDLVSDDGSGCFSFHGRRDRMIKKRGYRIELGEIESTLYRHDDVQRAAVIARSDPNGISIDAFITTKPGRKASIIAMKRHCSSYLPHYMIPDRVHFLDQLPTTSTDKIDYQSLKRLNTDSPHP
ncbi:MAG: hypothetical protein KatS3mg108_0290 [Isosphaeraceae bacterium]|jgi:amino acid adenylation domain-containing protein|nr:MAG: hypothetical protein KatS3mg108_0290 [Isosphaeraceae bacterium]